LKIGERKRSNEFLFAEKNEKPTEKKETASSFLRYR